MVGHLIVALDGVAFGLLLYVVAAGLTLILGAGGVFQLSHGVLYATGAYLAWWLGNGSAAGFVAALAVGALVGAGGGAVLGYLLRPLRHELDQVLATIGLGLIVADLLTSAFGAQPLAVEPPPALAGSVRLLGRAYPVYRLTFIAVALFLAGLLYLVVTRSRVGARIRAATSDPVMVAVVGINPHRLRVTVVAAGTMLAVAGGVLGAPVLGPAPGVDHTVLLLSLVVVIAGGPGSIGGALVAALAVGQIQTTVAVTWPAAAPYALFAMLAVALVARATIHAARARVT